MSKNFSFYRKMIFPFFQQNLNFFDRKKIFLNFSKIFEKLELSLRKGVYLVGRKRKERKKLPQNKKEGR